jgi:hypothetical protein
MIIYHLTYKKLTKCKEKTIKFNLTLLLFPILLKDAAKTYKCGLACDFGLYAISNIIK